MRASTVGVIVLLLAWCGSNSAQEQDESATAKSIKKACECNKYNCGCCQTLEWSNPYINETICANASYLAEDYGISITLTFNGFAVINETVSARNPPPICVASQIEELLPVDVCLKLYDVDYKRPHACFMVIGKIGIVKIPILHLGCVNFRRKLSTGGNWWQRLNMWKTHVNHNSVDEPFVMQT